MALILFDRRAASTARYSPAKAAQTPLGPVRGPLCVKSGPLPACPEPQNFQTMLFLLSPAKALDYATVAGLNVARYEAWSPQFTAKNSKQAVLAFNGDVYEGLNAKTLSEAQLAWAQQHVCILSGLYGVLRPLDWMQPYRLEMGTALTSTSSGARRLPITSTSARRPTPRRSSSTWRARSISRRWTARR